MEYQILLFIAPFIIYCKNFAVTKTLIGTNVRAANVQDFSYVVCIVGTRPNLTLEQNILCTASLISNTKVLTAEHCLDHWNMLPFRIIAGSHNIYEGISYYPFWVISYDQWATINQIEIIRENDIALVRTIEELPNELNVAAIPTLQTFNNIIGQSVIMAGWGVTNAGVISIYLNVVETTVVSNLECVATVSRLYGSWIIISPQVFYCSKAVPYALLRNGDSGGPLLATNIILAVNTATCPKMDLEIYALSVNLHLRLDNYLHFIADILQNE